MVATLRERTSRAEPSFDLDAPLSAARRRRAPELVGGVLVILVCVLAALWWQTASSAKTRVLVLRNPVERGHVMTVGDLQMVNIGTDDRIAMLTERDASAIVGRVSRNDLAAGTLVTKDLFSTNSLIGKDDGVVGLSLEAGQVPSLKLAAGDAVSVILTPTPSDPKSLDAAPTVLVARAAVVEVAEVGVQGRVFVAIQVGQADAAKVAAAAAANRVRLVQIAEG